MEATEAAVRATASREQEDLLQLLYLCPIAIVRLDAHGEIVLMNPHGTQLLMPLSSDGDLSNLFDVFRPFAPEVSEMVRRFVPGAGKVCEDHRVVVPLTSRPGSTTMILSLTLQKIDADLFVAVISDVTGSATRELQIRLSEERSHAVLDGVSEYAICTLDAQGAITSWNRSAERLDGFRIDEVMGRHIDMLAPSTGPSLGAFGKRIESARRRGSEEFETWRIRKDGSRYWAHCTISTLRKNHDETLLGFSIVTRDATERRRAEDHLRLLATTDPLTGALNRRAFLDGARHAEARSAETHEPLALLLLDVDKFKPVNDRYGHDAGDAVLQSIVLECRSEIRSTDVLGRIGGDEFAVVLTGATSGEAALATANRIRARIAAASFTKDGSTIAVTVSIGLAERRPGCERVDDLMRAADRAMYAAKHEGRDRVSVAAPIASA